VSDDDFADDDTVADGVPLEPVTPRPETTGAHRISSLELASAADLADRDGFARGVEHGRRLAIAEAEAAAVTEARRVREDAIETMRALWVIFEIASPDWPTAERWLRSRLAPL